jgi:hypothetical protein
MEGLRLEFSNERPTLDNLDEINHALAAFGSRVWPLDLGTAPSVIRGLLSQCPLTDQEAQQVQ